jgi:hypothetical protein
LAGLFSVAPGVAGPAYGLRLRVRWRSLLEIFRQASLQNICSLPPLRRRGSNGSLHHLQRRSTLPSGHRGGCSAERAVVDLNGEPGSLLTDWQWGGTVGPTHGASPTSRLSSGKTPLRGAMTHPIFLELSLLSGVASPLSGRTGKASSQAWTSSDRHIDLPPTTRARGKVPARIQDHRVGYETPPATNRTSGLVNNRSGRNGGPRGGTRSGASGAGLRSSASAACA